MDSTWRAISFFLAEETGASMMEYVLVGLLCFFVAVLLLLALSKSM